jgi:hypothetical protein
MLSEAMELADEIRDLALHFSLSAKLPTLREVGDLWRGVISAMKAVSKVDSVEEASTVLAESPDLISAIFGQMPTVTTSIRAASILAYVLKTIDNRWTARARFDDLGEAIEKKDWSLVNAFWEKTNTALETWTDRLIAPTSWLAATVEDSTAA